MNDNSLAAIARFENVREQEAVRLAYETFITAPPDAIKAIADYGQFIENDQQPPREALVGFHRAVATLRAYQDMISPLRDFEKRLDQFDNFFSVQIYQLHAAGERR